MSFLKIKNVLSYILLILNIAILKSGVMQKVFINECKPFERSNQFLFSVIFLFKNKSQIGNEINISKYNYLVVPFYMVRLINRGIFRIQSNIYGEHFSRNSYITATCC